MDFFWLSSTFRFMLSKDPTSTKVYFFNLSFKNKKNKDENSYFTDFNNDIRFLLVGNYNHINNICLIGMRLGLLTSKTYPVEFYTINSNKFNIPPNHTITSFFYYYIFFSFLSTAVMFEVRSFCPLTHDRTSLLFFYFPFICL